MTAVINTSRLIPPGPMERSLLGSLPNFRQDPFSTTTRYWQQYGDLYRMRLGPFWTYVPSHPDHVKHVMVDNAKSYSRGKFYKNFVRFIGNGLVALDGEEWLKHRRTVQPAFHRQAVVQYAGIVTEVAAGMLERWQSFATQGRAFDASYDIFAMVLSALGRSIFNVDLGEYAPQLVPAAHEGMRQLIQNVLLPEWMPTPQNRQFSAVRNLFDTVVTRIIAEHERGLHGDSDMVSMLLKERTANRLSTQQVHDEVLTHLVVGTDTTTAALSWTLYALAMHPEVRQKLEAEVDATLNERIPTPDDTPALVYTKMVIQEVLRLYPPVWLLARDPIHDDELSGYHVPAGSTVMLMAYLIHRHPEFWDDPEAFNPERFRPEREKDRHPYAYLPFGAGQHLCVGMHSAWQTLLLTVPMIVQKYRVELAPSGPVVPTAALTMHPRNGVRVKITRKG